jgi:hypothetical protein
MPHTRAAEAESLAVSVTPHVGVGMSDALGCLAELARALAMSFPVGPVLGDAQHADVSRG